MTAENLPVLVAALREPQMTLTLDLPSWDLLLRQARRAGVLARLGFLLSKHGVLSEVPEKALVHIKSAQTYAQQFDYSVDWEIQCILKALKRSGVEPVFLKGCAYFLAGNDAAQGRIFSDVDILVTKEQLPIIERDLLLAGWRSVVLNDYDQDYYRRWMHELPPMQHSQRETSIDVHHNILPQTCHHCPDAAKLMANKVKLENKNIWLLAAEDRVLHSAVHLFHEGELGHGLRDLSDLDLLLREFGKEDQFWDKLLDRSVVLMQQRPLFYMLRYTVAVLATPVPQNVLEASAVAAPGKLTMKIMDALFLRALMPDHESCDDRWTGGARWLLFIRSHWLRMPFYLLIPHLLRKSQKRLLNKDFIGG